MSEGSLTTCAELGTQACDRVIRECLSNRLLITDVSWEMIRHNAFRRRIKDTCGDDLVPVETLQNDLQEVLSEFSWLLGDDPTNQSDEPWVLALARREQSPIVSELGPLSALPIPLQQMGLNSVRLSQWLALP